MGLRGDAAIVGYVELPPERLNKAAPAPFILEQWADLAAAALEDAGLSGQSVNGIVTSHLAESEIFVPSTIAEYLGVPANFAELVDLGGASAAAMVWRAAAAIELGLCDVVVCALPARYITPMSEKKPPRLSDAVFFGSSSNQFGSPQAEFEIPYGNLGQNGPYGQVATRYGAVYGYDERAMAKIVVDQRFNANHTEGAIWKDKPLTVEDVLASPVIADPLHMSSPAPRWPGAPVTARAGSRASVSTCRSKPRRMRPTCCTPRWPRPRTRRSA
jgi:acetyl-CoA acetyltransferase